MIPSTIRAVIFDMDGLMIDSEPAWNTADRMFLTLHGAKVPPNMGTFTLGMGQKEALFEFKTKLGLVGEDETLIRERKEIFYKELFLDLHCMSGAKQLIEELSKKYQLAIATGGHGFEKIEEILQKLSLASFFSVLVSSDDVKRGKPFPDVYLQAAALLEINPKDCLVLEDAPTGVVAGKSAGMVVYGVNRDSALRELLVQSGADQIFSDLSEIVS